MLGTFKKKKEWEAEKAAAIRKWEAALPGREAALQRWETLEGQYEDIMRISPASRALKDRVSSASDKETSSLEWVKREDGTWDTGLHAVSQYLPPRIAPPESPHLFSKKDVALHPLVFESIPCWRLDMWRNYLPPTIIVFSAVVVALSVFAQSVPLLVTWLVLGGIIALLNGRHMKVCNKMAPHRHEMCSCERPPLFLEKERLIIPTFLGEYCVCNPLTQKGLYLMEDERENWRFAYMKNYKVTVDDKELAFTLDPSNRTTTVTTRKVA